MEKKSKVTIHGVEFSVQELMIIRELRSGATYQETARKLSLSVKTVEYHVKNLKEKTRTNSKEQLISFFDKSTTVEYLKHIEKKGLNLANNKNFLWKLIVFLIFVIGMMIVFYPNKKENKEVGNVLNFVDNFLDRPYIESKIVRKLKEQNGISVVVVCGTGGAGKTTISRKVLSSAKETIKFEINAETKETLQNSFMELADYVATTENQKRELEVIRNLQDSNYKKKSLIRFVSELLRQSNSWMLLMDNVSSFESIKEYFPTNEKIWGCGSVLITTRNRNLEENSFIKHDWVIDIGSLEEREKRELFSNIVYGCGFVNLGADEKEKVKKFLKTVPEFPLDVCAVAYYLKNTKISFDEYRKIVGECVKELNSEQKGLMKENASYGETRYGIVSSVFKEIIQNKKEYKLLLLILSLMDSQNVPKRIFKDAAGIISTDSFIRKLKEHSFVEDDGANISIHRSNHAIGCNYILENLQEKELVHGIHVLTGTICNKIKRGPNLIPHLESILAKISNIRSPEILKDKALLLTVLADVLRNYSFRMMDALKCLEQIIVMNDESKYLDEHSLALVKLKIAEIYTIISKNTKADMYLSSSLKFFPDDSMEKIRAYRLLGIVRMRQFEFEKANSYFISALNLLPNVRANKLQKSLSESDIYEDMSFNYFMDGINRENAKKAIPLMKKAIQVLEDDSIKNDEEVISRRAVHKIKLAGIYNALANYQKALEIAKETENLIDESKIDNVDTFYVRGLIARERGLSNLRLNKVARAYDYFEQARDILTKLQKGDYLFKIKTHEAECLVRMNKLNSAMKWCESTFAEQDRERTNYSDLFFNTSLYHAAIIKYKQKDYGSSRRYFQKFFRAMNVLCKRILAKDSYKKLVDQGAFNESLERMEEYFENSLKVFEEIYWKDYEFTKYYVEKNLSVVKFIHKNRG